MIKEFKNLSFFLKLLIPGCIFFFIGFIIGLARYFLQNAPEKIILTSNWTLFPYEKPFLFFILSGIEVFLALFSSVLAFLIIYLIFKKGWVLFLGIFFMISGGIGMILAGIFAQPLDKTLLYFLTGGIFGLITLSLGVYALYQVIQKKIKRI